MLLEVCPFPVSAPCGSEFGTWHNEGAFCPLMQMETAALRQQLQEDWEAGEAERQELVRQMRFEAEAAAAQVRAHRRLSSEALVNLRSNMPKGSFL